MPASQPLLLARLSPPRSHRRLLVRPRLIARLREAGDYRLAVLQAGAGYGKTTALASLADAGLRCAWCSVSEQEAEPQRFLSYLLAALRQRLPALPLMPDDLLRELATPAAATGATDWGLVADALVNVLHDQLTAPLYLVIDDYELVAKAPEISALLGRLVRYKPPELSVLIASRELVDLPGLTGWRARGELLELGTPELALSAAEIVSLFERAHGVRLSPSAAAELQTRTEGWPIALHLIGQGLRQAGADCPAGLDAVAASGGEAEGLDALFAYLAEETFERQPSDIAEFLLSCAVLRTLTPEACLAVTGRPHAGALLRSLCERDLFLVELESGAYRFHHLFRDFLTARAAPRRTRQRHRRAARHFEASGNDEEAIHHWLMAAAWREAVVAIGRAGAAVLAQGRVETVAAWIRALPPELLAREALLCLYRADIARFGSRFETALHWYREAERIWRQAGDAGGVGRALRGQILVYLDTVRPSEAESLLDQAMAEASADLDRAGYAELLELLAENKLNSGALAEAEALRQDARNLRGEPPGEDTLSVRIQLRAGALDQAAETLQRWWRRERADGAAGRWHSPRSHREIPLLLAVIHSFKGEAQAGRMAAEAGIVLGERLGSPVVACLGHARRGHAVQLAWAMADRPPEAAAVRAEALQAYQSALALSDRIAVPRVRAEILWGLARLHGFADDLESAERLAAEGLQVARGAGDVWISALLELTVAAAYVCAGRLEPSMGLLQDVLATVRRCGNHLGEAATALWLSLAGYGRRRPEQALHWLGLALELCEVHGYDFLFTRPSMLGPPDPRRVVPLLIMARNGHCRSAYADRLLRLIGLPEIAVHPGYQLRVQTLGAFRVWRGELELGSRDWRRSSARELFQFLVSARGRWLQRDELMDRLRPDADPQVAQRDFKAALNSLNTALEPVRDQDAPFAYVAREGTAYRLREGADLWLDVDVFERACETGLRLLECRDATGIGYLQEALEIYHGDYLPDTVGPDWANQERDRLRNMFLRAAEALGWAFLQSGRLCEALSVCQRMLDQDSCWEQAYHLTMLAYAVRGNRAQALKTYQRCTAVLREELDVAPTRALQELCRRLQAGEDVQVGMPTQPGPSAAVGAA